MRQEIRNCKYRYYFVWMFDGDDDFRQATVYTNHSIERAAQITINDFKIDTSSLVFAWSKMVIQRKGITDVR